MAKLNQLMSGSGATTPEPSSDAGDQAEHAASPNHYGFQQNAKTIVLALLGIYGFIYLLHVVERVAVKA